MPDKPVKEASAFDMLFRFTVLRQTGTNRDEAWYQVCDEAPNASEVTRNAFLALAKNWERTEGHKYHYRQNPDADSTLSRKQVGDVPAAQESTQSQTTQEPSAAQYVAAQQPAAAATATQSQSAPQGRAALTGTLDPAQLRDRELRNMEQVLDVLDAEEDEDAAPTMPRLGPAKAGGTAPMRHPDDFFGPNTILLMYFKTFPHPLRVKIAGSDELFIGRATANSAMSPEIDLNPINAGDFGVSRLHAVITRQNNKLLIADLDSMNCTYINGVRAFPREPYTLRDGDEIWFGQLQCRFVFSTSKNRYTGEPPTLSGGYPFAFNIFRLPNSNR